MSRDFENERNIRAACNRRYVLDQTNKFSLKGAVSPRALAYNATSLGKGYEYKVQDYIFKNKGPLFNFNDVPIFSFQLGNENGQVIGNSINIKEITMKALFFMDIPVFDITTKEYSIRVPQIVGKLAIVYNKDPYNFDEGNFLRFGDVFANVDPSTGTTYINSQCFEKIGNEERYRILYKTSFSLGSYMANYPVSFSFSDDTPTSIPLQTSQPYFYYGVCHLNLWDKVNLSATESISGSTTNKSEEMGIFSKGLEMDFRTEQAERNKTVNDITRGSLWVVIALDEPEYETPEDAGENISVSMKYYTRVIYT